MSQDSASIATYLTSPTWWFTVVVASFLINLASAYAKPVLDRVLSRGHGRWRALGERRETARSARVQRLRESPHEQVMAGLFVIHHVIMAVVIAALVLLLGWVGLDIAWSLNSPVRGYSRVTIGAISVLFLIIGTRFWTSAAEVDSELSASRRT